MKDKYVIIGCGGHARSILDVILYNNPDADITFLDENAKPGEKVFGFPIKKDLNITNEKVIVGFGDNEKRRKLSLKYQDNLVSVISKNAYIGKDVKIGKGVFVAHNTHIGINSQIEDFCVINTSASVDHECIIGKNSFVGPNSTLCGKVELGENVFCSAAATIIPNIKICSDTIIGAGAVVVKNITEPGTFVGIPANKVSKL